MKPKLEVLDALRGFCAIMVVVLHFSENYYGAPWSLHLLPLYCTHYAMTILHRVWRDAHVGEIGPTSGTWIGRQGSADEMARAIFFLAADESGFITGVDIPVDGGRILGPHNCDI